MFRKHFCYELLVSLVLWSFPALVATEGAYRIAARQLESLTTHDSGVLNDLPEEIRARRVGQVHQKVTVSDDGVITVHRSFSCKPQLCRTSQPKLFAATGDHSIVLSEFRKGGRYRIEPHRHEGFVQISDVGARWSIDVARPSDVATVASLITTLATEAPDNKPVPSSLPSEMARAAGFRYLVVVPRCEEVGDTVGLLTYAEPSPHMHAYLTKSSADSTEELLRESCNRLPLVLFELNTLDTGTFYTTSVPGASFFFPYALDELTLQSIMSTEGEQLGRFFATSPYVGICCTSMFNLSNPTKVLCRPEDDRVLEKAAKSSHVTVAKKGWIFCTPLNAFFSAPHGTALRWIEGMNDNSDDVLRYCLLDRPLTPNLVRYVLYEEFPDLRSLLKMPSCYGKDRSIEETICLSSLTLQKRARTLSPAMVKILRIALFAHELGAPFGPASEVSYNSWPMALAVSEKMGLDEHLKTAVYSLIESSPVALSKKKSSKESMVQALVQESERASRIGTNLGDWLNAKCCFMRILTDQFQSKSGSAESLHMADRLRVQYASLLPFGLPTGVSVFRGPYETREPYSCYIWELRDPLHRDGLSLKRRREKFEHLIVNSGKRELRGRFWSWLDKETKGILFPCVYLRTQDREQYLARFENGVLVHPSFPTNGEEIETMFVVDEWGRLYLGIKKEGCGAHDPGFNHASFLCGGNVASAGKLTFRSGKPILITDHSGHYRCGPEELKIALKILERMGVAIDDIEVHTGAGRGKDKLVWKSGKIFTSRSTDAS